MIDCAQIKKIVINIVIYLTTLSDTRILDPPSLRNNNQQTKIMTKNINV